jgi:tripeptide aminopeptidase
MLTHHRRTAASRLLLCALAAGLVAPAAGTGLRAQSPPRMSAADYVISKFADHDIVLLGEMHYMQQNLVFLRELIPRLHAAGVHHLGYEFAHYQDQPKIDALLSARAYDEELARAILLNWHAPGRFWSFQEYLDIFRAAWELNRALPAGARRFRIVALGVPDRPQDWSGLRPGEHPLNAAVRNRMLGAQFYDAVNIFWADVITRELIARGVPALIYAGAGHTYTKFFHDRRQDNGIAAGNLIYNQIGERVVRINLHGSAGVSATRHVDALMREPEAPGPGTGFDLAGTAFGRAPVLDIRGYRDGRSSGFTLADIADGYVYLAPIAEWRPVTLIPGFATPRTRHTIQMSLGGANPADPPLELAELEARMASALRRSFDGLVARFLETQNGDRAAVHADAEPMPDPYDDAVRRLAATAPVRAALERIEREHARTLRDQITLNEIPAPPFAEAARARHFARLLREAGADSVAIDEIGNVIALRRGIVRDSAVVLSGHLDTVFPEGTDVSVEARGDTLFAPGIGDDARGLAVIASVLRTLHEEGLRTRDDVLFVGTVGEEGLGDLRGIKHFFRDGRGNVRAFVSVDTDDAGGIVHRGIGSRRYRVTMRGPGGHSWSAFGRANPLHALATSVHRFVEAADPHTLEGPRTTYNVGRSGGGTSINAIPAEAWVEIDLRSEDQQRLLSLDRLLHDAVTRSVDEHNARRREALPLEAELALVGDRPPGLTDAAHPLVRTAAALYRWSGLDARLVGASTDANLPKSLGIPALAVSGGGIGGDAHSPAEWWLDARGAAGVQRVLLLALLQAGYDPQH